ncbi:MAG: hypothetical protein HRU38_18930 [Saccharospirillaceae bacterium]|nr:hypothetical protein [Pseudomonadales bacterium]NRB80710.1 hypothetical protein [Saccharospirillaceae bacterium]
MSSCVGIVALNPGTEKYENPVRSYTGNWLIAHNGNTPIKKIDVILRWGEPSSKEELSDGTEKWVFKSGVRFLGLIPFVIIPIPLIVPVGKNSWTLILKDGVVIYAEHKNTSGKGFICGLSVKDGLSGDSGKSPGCEVI